MTGHTDEQGTPLEVLELSTRTYNSLRRGGFRTVEELLRAKDHELMAAPNFGQKSLAEIKERLQTWLHNPMGDSSPQSSREESNLGRAEEATPAPNANDPESR